jgi:hypothetical protein
MISHTTVTLNIYHFKITVFILHQDSCPKPKIKLHYSTIKVINPGKNMQPQFFDIIYSSSAPAKEILNNRLTRHLILDLNFILSLPVLKYNKLI